MNKKEQAIVEKQLAIVRLKAIIKPGDTILTILRHVSASGMKRVISLKFIDSDCRLLDISYDASLAMRSKLNDKWNGIEIGGCGMDMGFAMVYNLSHYMWPDGFDCIGDQCPANDHFNNVPKSHHSNGGYALRQRWI